MKHILSIAVLSAVLALSGCKDKHEAGHHDPVAAVSNADAAMVITQSFLRPPLPGRTTAMAVFEIENKTDTDDVLLSVSSSIAQTVEIHTIITEGDIKKMRRIEDGISVPAGGKAILKHGGDHVMLFEARVPEDAAHIPLTLNFKHLGSVEIQAVINDGSTGHHGGH